MSIPSCEPKYKSNFITLFDYCVINSYCIIQVQVFFSSTHTYLIPWLYPAKYDKNVSSRKSKHSQSSFGENLQFLNCETTPAPTVKTKNRKLVVFLIKRLGHIKHEEIVYPISFQLSASNFATYNNLHYFICASFYANF